MSGGLNDLDIGPVVDAIRGLVDDFVSSRHSAPAVGSGLSSDLSQLLSQPPPSEPGNLDLVVAMLNETLGPGFDSAGAGFLSYIPTGALPVSGLGAYLGATTNRYTGANHAAPAMVALEQSVIDWMIGLFGMPSTAGGVLFSGGSIANLTATVAARFRFGDDFSNGVVYTSEQAHHSVVKAARIAGIAADRVRGIATDDHLRLDPTALEDAIATDRSASRRPLMVVATAGTTDTGAIDPLAACAEIAHREGAWFHVDAAYGGFFQLTERGRDRLQGIQLADSITIDAHKSLFLPFGIGGLLVRDVKTLVDAHEGHGSYMQDITDGTTLPQFFAMGPELSRPNRGLQVWLPLHIHGVDAFEFELDRMLDLADQTATLLHDMAGVDVITKSLSIVTFAAAEGQEATRRMFNFLNASGEVHVSSTTLRGRFVIRAAFLSQRTTQHVADRLVALVGHALAHR